MASRRGVSIRISFAMTLVLIAAILVAVLPVQMVDAARVQLPDQSGPYKVGYYKTTYQMPPYGTYRAVIRYPAKYNRYRAPSDTSGGPYPGIVVSNGLFGSEWQITWIAKHLASHGYVTICFTPPRVIYFDATQWAYGFNGGIEKLKAENAARYSKIKGILDTTRFGVIGLSMGGAGCLEATGTNPEIDAAVPLAPAVPPRDMFDYLYADVRAAVQNIKVPTQIQAGSNDAMVRPELAAQYYSLMPDTTPKEFVEIKGANHVGFIDDFYARVAAFLRLDKPNDIGFEAQRRVSSRYFTAWFQYWLKGLSGYSTYIFGQEAQKDLKSGVLSDLKCNL